MTVEPSTGLFTLASGTVLGPGLTRARFLASPEGSAATVFARNEPWCSFRFAVPEESLVMVAFFNGNALESLSLTVDDSGFNGATWDDWAKEKELARVKANDAWLAAHKMPIGSSDWGAVWSGVDDKSGSSHVVVRFR